LLRGGGPRPRPPAHGRKMMRVELIGLYSSKALRLGLVAGLLSAAGCSGPTSEDKKDDPALKASMQKSMEIYKAKSQAKKQSRPASRPRA
jgi:hypothetical protein